MHEKIEIKNLNFSFYKGAKIINDISLSILKGEFLSILGASGSGKSTLLRIISGILPNDKDSLKGEISIFGKTPEAYLDTGKLSFMFQDASLMPNLNVKDNITFPLKLRGKEIELSFIDELLQIVGLENHKYKYPTELSGGMKTRVSLARAFVTKPTALLLDEPFSALDVSWRYDLYQYLQKFVAKYKTTVIFVTHDIQEAIILGDSIIVFSQKGKVLRKLIPIKNKSDFYDFETINKIIKDNVQNHLSLQTEIMIDGIRESASLNDAIETVSFLEEKVNRNEEDNRYVFARIHSVKKFINNDDIYIKLVNIWEKSKSRKFKDELMWRILDNPKASQKIHQNIYNFIISDWDKYVTNCQSQEYFQKTLIINRTIDRLKDQDYPSTKDWLYLVYLKAMSEGDSKMESKAKAFIKQYIENNKMNKSIKSLIMPLIEVKYS